LPPCRAVSGAGLFAKAGDASKTGDGAESSAFAEPAVLWRSKQARARGKAELP
jgi:hypothetical protein